MANTTTSSGPFDLITGLPVHVLVTHAVVVLLPLAVLTLILVITIPKLRSHYRYPAVGLAILGAISAVIAEQQRAQSAMGSQTGSQTSGMMGQNQQSVDISDLKGKQLVKEIYVPGKMVNLIAK